VVAQTYISGDNAVNIARSVEAGVAAGRVAAGDLLPPVRTLADSLRVSPATVAAAYRMLQQRGIVAAEGRRGTRVRKASPVASPAPPPLPRGVRDLASGNPDPQLLPDLFEQRLYRDDLNDPRLIALAQKQFAADGVPARHVAVVSGALDGLERVLRELTRAGDRIAVEDPGFTGVIDLLASLSLIPVPVSVDDDGPIASSLRGALRSSRALIVSPRAQNPTGAAITPQRARELRRVLHEFPEVVVIEDDHAGPVAGAKYVTLAGGRERWAVVRSVSKPLGPDLRLALLAGDAETIARVEGRQTLGIRWVSHVLQRLVIQLWTDRRVQRQLKLAEKTYTQRRNALIAELDARGIAAHGASGLNVWIPLREESAVVQSLMARGWAVNAGERYRIASGPAIRVTIATLTPDDAKKFAADLAAIIRPARSRGAV
jgi:DNA-binding transcriptional MocR family regulator